MVEIQVLREDVINKIAAGEVVERPASVVKELVENSIDAGASQIEVDIENSGKGLIRIRDDGCGMSEENVRKCVLRHATSKIVEIDDLHSIRSLGFRGEAMSSIASVSQMSIITRRAQDIEGFNLVLEGGEVISSGVIGAQRGTTIEVRNLFFNTPARLKFLKTDSVELRHIIDVITHYALLYKEVAFTLRHEKHVLIKAPSVESGRSNIASIFGMQVAKNLLEVDCEKELVRMKGFVCKPYDARNDKNQQVLFVNNRWVKNSEITQAVYEAYHSMLFVGKHPIFVLELELDTKMVDINVHPQKKEIKIERIREICSQVKDVIRQVLADHNLIPDVNVEFAQVEKMVERPKYGFEKSAQQTLEVKESEVMYGDVYATKEGEVHEREVTQGVQEVPTGPEEVRHRSLPEIKLFGQVHKTFFIAETQGGAFFIDQHAAHERVLYERFMKQFEEKGVAVQSLLSGGVIEVSLQEKVLIEEYLEEFSRYGFTLEEFGEHTYLLKTIPVIFNRLAPEELLREFLAILPEGKNAVERMKEVIITRMACRAAVMAGDVLTNIWMQSILDELGQCDHPYTCPHGRPSIIKITSDELEKKFRRKGC